MKKERENAVPARGYIHVSDMWDIIPFHFYS